MALEKMVCADQNPAATYFILGMQLLDSDRGMCRNMQKYAILCLEQNRKTPYICVIKKLCFPRRNLTSKYICNQQSTFAFKELR